MEDKSEAIMSLFYEVVKLDRKFSAENFKKSLNGQYMCLLLLEGREGLSQKELGNLLRIQPATVSEFITKLERKGFVKRSRSPEDKRVCRIFLTKEGEEAAVRARKGRERVHAKILRDLSEEEKEQLFRILTKMKSYFLQTEGER